MKSTPLSAYSQVDIRAVVEGVIGKSGVTASRYSLIGPVVRCRWRWSCGSRHFRFAAGWASSKPTSRSPSGHNGAFGLCAPEFPVQCDLIHSRQNPIIASYSGMRGYLRKRLPKMLGAKLARKQLLHGPVGLVDRCVRVRVRSP
jgi:hypothetical protein